MFELIAARAFAISCGYKDGNELNRLRHDPLLKIAVGRCPESGSPLLRCHVYVRVRFALATDARPPRRGARHRIPFVFHTLGLRTEPLLGRYPTQSLADVMHAAWIAFAESGDCGWPKYDSVRRSTMRFDTASQVVDNPLAAELALWKAVTQRHMNSS
jgi:carboxylesterase type B